MYTFSNIHRTYNKYFSRNTNQGEIHLAKVIIHTFLKTMRRGHTSSNLEETQQQQPEETQQQTLGLPTE